ncbi:ABC transporter substrate-binding protein [Methylobacterium organophilum]|uniref:ABC transporter substrate-binding protein n=1 Tax=Methylobacterium organophilum TaxID=410 RepID=UPI001F12A9C7|nr:ABC transporter substrate-binding protein [Methylobacterium organophilum]UMY16131.1 ABC transporter substrate-binding protein [Methylobacterium organophilum]
MMFSHRQRRVVLRGLLRLAGFLALAAVPTATGTAKDRNTAERTLIVVGPWEVAGLDPSSNGYAFTRLQVAETLVGVDAAGAPAPGLATGWTVSPDGLTWRFPLRMGVRFHDGAPLNADAAAGSLRRAQANVGPLSRVPIAAIAAEDDVVVVSLERPFALLPAFLANHTTIILAPASYDPSGRVVRMIGTGPYRAAAITPPLRIELERFDGWWGGCPPIARARYLAVGQGETRALMAESGEADVVVSILPVSLARLRHDPKLVVQTVTPPRTRLLKLNAGSPLFSDPRARHALSLALDRAGLAKVLLRNAGLGADQLFPPAVAGWHAERLPPLTRDLVQARLLLAQAGWRPGPDGILERDGHRFSATLRTYSAWPELPPLAAAIQAQAREVGIDLAVSIGNTSDIPARHRDGSLDLGLVSRSFAMIPDPLGTLLQDFGPDGGDWGAMNWPSAETATLLDRLTVLVDPAERAPLQRRLGEILQAELPVIPVTWAELAVVANRRVAGVRADPLERSYGLAGMRWNTP